MPTASPISFPDVTSRFDPYRNYRFRVKWDGQYVAGISRVSGLTRTTEASTHRSGEAPGTARLSPGQTTFEPITLERGITQDVMFEQWANKVWSFSNARHNPGGGDATSQDVSLADFRKDVTIELFNEAGQKVLAWNVYRCWVSAYTALPQLDAGSNSVVIESITLQNEGWERDTAVQPPMEPAYNAPSANPGPRTLNSPAPAAAAPDEKS